MPINKFGSHEKGHGESSSKVSEYAITRIVQRILSEQKSINFKAESEEFDSEGKRIGNVGHPIYDKDAVNKIFVEDSIWSNFDKFPEKNLDMKKKRIKNLLDPVDPDNAATKKYVDSKWNNHLLFPICFTLQTFTILDLADKKEYFMINPYNNFYYSFPFEAYVQLNACNFNDEDIQVRINDNIYLSVSDKKFHYVKEGDQLRFRKISNKKINDQTFAEFLIKSCADGGEK